MRFMAAEILFDFRGEALVDLFNRAFQNAWVPGNPSWEREILNARALENWQHTFDARATEKDVDTDVDCRPGRDDLAFTVKRHYF